MNASEMRAKCWLCEYYQLICYADGSSTAGCKAAGEDGHPASIREMESCPRGHSRKCQDINRQDLLALLNRIYVATAVSPGELSLYKMVAEYASLRGKRTIIGLAITTMGIVEKLGNKVPGHRGVFCTYRWNASVGPPSLNLCDRIVHKTEELTYEMVRKRMERRQHDAPVSRPVKIEARMRGITSCARCRLKEVQNCREKLMDLGYNCKKVNVNELPYEITMGLATEGQQGLR